MMGLGYLSTNLANLITDTMMKLLFKGGNLREMLEDAKTELNGEDLICREIVHPWSMLFLK